MTSSSPMVRGILLRLVRIRTLADTLPGVLYIVATNGKLAAAGLLGVYAAFLGVWFPLYLLSWVIGEWGIYLIGIVTVFFIGRAVIRMIAFPGASQKVVGDMEAEFARYSSRMMVSSADALLQVVETLAKACPTAAQPQPRHSPDLYDLPIYWRRAGTYRDRVLGVYVEVLGHLYGDAHTSQSDLTRYGNNRLVGDVGNLSGLTPSAIADGRALLQRLRSVLDLLDQLARVARPVLEAGLGPTTKNPLTEDAANLCHQLIAALKDLKDFSAGLKSGDEPDETDEDLTVDAVRRKFEEPSGTPMDTIYKGLASILPMIDPPPHDSIFGFDVQRGCMLSRYCGARQLWIDRPRGGKLDVLHFPAMHLGKPVRSNRRAVVYCNPNAGLIEVATGMSLVGGNVPASDAEQSAADNSWTDYYTQIGFDVYVFNYAGYGRSYGTTLCASGENPGDHYHPGILARANRIFKSCFLAFKPTPDTLREDGVAVAKHVLDHFGVDDLIIHGESIGGVAASGAGRYLSQSTAMRDKLRLLICDRTFCNLEAVAQRLVGGWSGYAIRALAPLWSTDVTGDFLAAECPKIVANDAADAIIADSASLKSGIALWKELRRGLASTKHIGWIQETPLQYRMADWENVCVNDSRYAGGLGRTQAPVWPADKHVSVEEAFHFAACCTRIAKLARQSRRVMPAYDEAEPSIEFDDRTGAVASRNLLAEVWKVLACCDGLTGAPLGIAVKRGFDSTVAWLCSLVVFGGQTVVAMASKRRQGQGESSSMEIAPEDFDARPPNYREQENEGMIHPIPIPEVISKLTYFMEAGDETLVQVSHELQFAIGVLAYVQTRLSSPATVAAALASCNLERGAYPQVGCFVNLHCGHNNAFDRQERELLRALIDMSASPASTNSVV